MKLAKSSSLHNINWYDIYGTIFKHIRPGITGHELKSHIIISPPRYMDVVMHLYIKRIKMFFIRCAMARMSCTNIFASCMSVCSLRSAH
jgi:hypothetical protein